MVKEISVQELKQMIDNGDEHQLIDVREPYERDIATIGGKNLPLGQLLSKSDQVSRNKKVIIYCRSGARSANAVQQLQAEFGSDNLFNLKGGILAWSDEVDPSIRKY